MDRKISFLFVVLIALLAWIPASAQDDQPAWDELPVGEWTQIATDDGICLYGDDYSFFARPSAEPSNKLLVYFQGGGACWDGFTCGQIGQFASFYDIDPTIMNFYRRGIFDFDNTDNPLADFNMVFVPYCSGDVHSGSNEITFDVPAEANADFDTVDVYFNGHGNSQAVLEWVYENIEMPDELVVAGCSAGGYGAVTQAPYLMEHYADVPAVMFADASAGVLVDDWTGLETWNTLASVPDFIPNLSKVSIEQYSTTYYIEQSALYFPENGFAQYNSYIDGVQVGFYGASQGEELDFENNGAALAAIWSRTLTNNTDQLTQLDNYNHYTAGGFDHCIINTDLFYEYDQNDVLFSDWFADVLTRQAGDVACGIFDGSCFVAPNED